MLDVQPRQAIQDALDRAIASINEQKEEALREVLIDRLPRPLRWAAHHPRALRALFWLRPSWRPVITYCVDPAGGGHGVFAAQRQDGTVVIYDTFRVS